jgi:HdeA/HdeB family
MNPNRITAAVLLSGLLGACAPQSPEATTPPAPAEATAPLASAEAPAAAPAPGAAAVPAPEVAPVDRIVNIQGAGCEDLLKLSPEDRGAASMFYIGYQASRLRTRTINVSLIPSIEAQAVTYCQENPRRTVAQAFAEAYSRTRR